MKRLAIEIKGVAPLLMHRFPIIPVEGMAKMTPEDQAEHAAYRIPGTSDLYVPSDAILGSLVNAAKFSKGKGRASLQSVAKSCITVDPEYVSLGQSSYSVDIRPVVIKGSGRILRCRPRLDAWSLGFTVDYDEILLSEKNMRQIVDDAGRRVGLLDFRPRFGRFMVTSWKSERCGEA